MRTRMTRCARISPPLAGFTLLRRGEGLQDFACFPTMLRCQRSWRLFTRRDMLGRLAWGLTFLPAVAFAPRSILNTLLFEPDGPLVPAKPLPPNPFMRDGKALVAIVRGDDPLAMLHAGLN